MDESELLPLLGPSKFQALVGWGGSALIGSTRIPAVIESTTDGIKTWDEPQVTAGNEDFQIAVGPHPEAFKYTFYPSDGVAPIYYGGGRGFTCRSADPPGYVYDRDFIIGQRQGGTNKAHRMRIGQIIRRQAAALRLMSRGISAWTMHIWSGRPEASSKPFVTSSRTSTACS